MTTGKPQCDFCFADAVWRGDVEGGEPHNACNPCFEARRKSGEFSGGDMLDLAEVSAPKRVFTYHETSKP